MCRLAWSLAGLKEKSLRFRKSKEKVQSHYFLFDLDTKIQYQLFMNSKQRKIYKKIFAKPTKTDVTWVEVQSLLVGCGAIMKEGRGSRVRFFLNNQILDIHKPHPQKEMKKYAVELVQAFLTTTGVKPNE